jgi:CheY-like chemotaxis protein
LAGPRSCPFPGAKELFELARVLSTLAEDGRAVRDAEVGALVGFENARTSRWKHGQINVSDAARLLALAEALDVDAAILAEVAAGKLRADDAVPIVLDEERQIRWLARAARPPREGAPLSIAGSGGLEIVVEKRGRRQYERRERRGRAVGLPPERPRTALLADDDADSIAVFQNVAGQQPGLHAEVVSTTAQALVAAGRLAPHLVLLDPFLPGADGFSVLRALSRDPATRGALLVAILGRKSDDLAAKATGAGASEVVDRPLRATVLSRLLKRVL